MKIATIAHPITTKEKTIWNVFAELHYDFKMSGGWATIVIPAYGRMYPGTFSCRFECDDPLVEPPLVSGDIMTCTRQSGTPCRIGRIYTKMDEHGNFLGYKGMFDSCFPMLPGASSSGNFVFHVFQK